MRKRDRGIRERLESMRGPREFIDGKDVSPAPRKN